ncbi:uncharacterized protein LOC126820983 [Patella vulgata]|uniref:uncharacterized protein LOC126820983 n=1 Tax=Patella vulgata TaxID=6465 RepID=UPI0021807BE5|nr:uncharacterized protein LOC126820983 [Patella vulgata]XP_050405182.1 uncharacterized protein LOC126820983 [Patella vulgata]
MDKINGLRDIVKKKYEKKCCIKVAIGVASVIVLLIIIIVAVQVSSDSPADEVVPNKNNAIERTSSPPTIVEVDIPNQFLLRMGSKDNPTFHEILAVEDTNQIYLMQIDEQYKTVYVVVNFKQKANVYIGMRKENVDGILKETTMLFCHESRFGSDFTGTFLESSALTSGEHTVPGNGRTTTLNVDDVGNVFTVPPTITSVLNGSCSDIPSDTMLKWKDKSSNCESSSSSVDINNSSTCSLSCPKCEDLAQTEKQSCRKFHQCNYDMGNCDPYWKTQNSYNSQPYCICRKTLYTDMRGISCANDGTDCEVNRRGIVDFENINPCFCRYRIPIIHPFLPSLDSKNILFTIQSVIVTAPAQTFGECDL